MPLMPHMSPAAIGCSVVMLRGWPSASKRSPIAASTASGQPSAGRGRDRDDRAVGDEAAASAAEMTLGLAMRPQTVRSIGRLGAGLRRFERRDRDASDLTPSSPVAEGCAVAPDRRPGTGASERA